VDLQTAAERLGVHYQTAYRWVREGALPAMKRGSVYEIGEGDLAEFREKREQPAPPPRKANVRSWPHQVDRLFSLLAAGDELGARQLVDRLREGAIEPLALCEELLAPTLQRVGEGWAEGALSVAHEHRAAAICERLLARIAVHPRGRPRGVAIVGTPPGEEHGLPATMAAVVLRADRWQVHHLGTQVPGPDLVDLARTLEADLVALSLTNREAEPAACALGDQVRAATDAVVLVGAPGRPLRELVEAARRLG
jgi:excisionase family DNA binding protein